MMEALAGWLSWLECCPIQQKIVGLIPGQGTYLGRRFDPGLGHVWEAAIQCFSLTSMFLSLPVPIPYVSKYISKYPR